MSFDEELEMLRDQEPQTVTLDRDEYEDMMEMIHDAFVQACGTRKDGEYVYDHQCLSTWEHIQDFLIENKRITKEQCSRH